MSQPRATAPMTVEEANRHPTVAPQPKLLKRVLDMDVNPDRIVTSAPEEPFRLTFIDVTCLVINRTIGLSTQFTRVCRYCAQLMPYSQERAFSTARRWS